VIYIGNINNWQTAITSSWSEVWVSFLGILPKIIGAIFIFALGVLIAFWVKRLVIEMLRLIKLDKLSESSGLNKYLKKAEITLSVTELLGAMSEWLIIIVFFLSVLDILGLTVVSQVLAQMLGYVPNIFAAILIFAAGYLIANLLGTLMRGALASVDHEIAKPAGKVTRWLILVIAFFAAVEQLKIARSLINTFFQGLTYTVVLVIGLSVGLGAKDLVSRILTDWYEKIKK
jgi:TRAP-type mannitol/chloroaromatic compound transport system permease small subunit